MAKANGISARERAEQATRHVLTVWEGGNLPAIIAQSVLAAKSATPCSKWSLGNRIAMIAQGTHDARGFQQWKEAGRNVRKGSKAIYILGPCFVKRDKEAVNSELALIGFRGIPVFRFQDTEGQPLEQSDFTPETLPPLQTVAQRIGVRVSYTPALADFMGRYIPHDKAIELCTHQPATWFHELAHAVDDFLGSMKPAKSKAQAAYKDGEVVAEFTAAALCSLYAIPYEHNALRYIEHYRKDAAKAVNRLFARIEAVLTFILEHEPAAETSNVETVAKAA
ncbi:MAG: M48 family peptidase [Planctomycetes bacterium]|nr:M48 family peptidase [Planctomycetota bacterium]